MTKPHALAHSWLRGRDIKATSGGVAMALRRICAAGRLAVVPGFLDMGGIVRTRTLEHERDLVPAGAVIAEVWVASHGEEQTQRLAHLVHSIAAAHTARSGQALLIAVHQAGRLDRARSWLRWRRWRASLPPAE